MTDTVLLPAKETNLSIAWGKAFLHIMENAGTEISPLIVTIKGFDNGVPKENNQIREALDKTLESYQEQSVHTVANTIFPESLWRYAEYDRHRLYEIYMKSMPRRKALSPRKNNRGLYFERLISFGSNDKFDGNQLEFIINQYNSRKSVRKSMFQASIFDPMRDHTPVARLGFPCLQHISLIPVGKNLTLNAFYATQRIFQKGYGNFLGLCRLGNFMAYEMKLNLNQMNCFIGLEKLEEVNGKHSIKLKNLVKIVRDVIRTTEGQI
jgi:hypothetical protein